MRLVLATANPDKAKEMAAVLGSAFELLPRPAQLGEVEETGATLEENARLKAVASMMAGGMAALAEDTGLEVDALEGRPGVFSARFAGPDATYADNVAALLAALEGAGANAAARRTARFRTVAMACFPEGGEVAAEGVVEGFIADAPRGHGGFGYDPVFVPAEGDGRTFAEMEPEEKHVVSHRGRALRAVAALLQGQPAGA